MLAGFGVDVLAPSVTLRRIWVLWNRLPPGARVGTDPDSVWSQESHLLALAVDWLAHLDYVTRQVWSKTRLKEPEPVPRPSQQTRDVDGKPKPRHGTTPWRDMIRKLSGGQVRHRGR